MLFFVEKKAEHKQTAEKLESINENKNSFLEEIFLYLRPSPYLFWLECDMKIVPVCICHSFLCQV